MASLDDIFHELLTLQGQKVEVGLQSTGERLQGVVVNTMFDSFLLETGGKRRAIRFDDIQYLDEIPSGLPAAGAIGIR